MFQGWKTLIFSAAIAVFGVLETFDWTTVFSEDKAGIAITIIGIISAGLRFVTKSPVAQKVE